MGVHSATGHVLVAYLCMGVYNLRDRPRRVRTRMCTQRISPSSRASLLCPLPSRASLPCPLPSLTTASAAARSEIIKNLHLPACSTLRTAALARNQFTRTRLTADFWHGIEKVDHPVNRAATPETDTDFDIPVFTCSAVEHQRHQGLRQAEGSAQA